MLTLQFKRSNDFPLWETVEANELFVVGRRYLQFTPKDGRSRTVLETNPCIREVPSLQGYNDVVLDLSLLRDALIKAGVQ